MFEENGELMVCFKEYVKAHGNCKTKGNIKPIKAVQTRDFPSEGRATLFWIIFIHEVGSRHFTHRNIVIQ